MKNPRHNSILFSLALLFVLGLTLPNTLFAATMPPLGTSGAFGILSSTFTNSNTALQTAITGDVCYTTAPVTPPVSITGTLTVPCAVSTGSDQSAALADLNAQACVSLGAAVTLSGIYTPGCYFSTGSMDIALGTTVTLNGTGVYIFRSAGALTTGSDSFVVLTGGATASNVFWVPVGAVTLGAYTTGGIPPATPTFIGNIFDAAGITFGHFANLLGRAWAFGGTVTTDANTIIVPSTLHVIKSVVNTGGGTAAASDFTLSVKLAGIHVTGSPAAGTATPGTAYSLSAGTYVVSEDTNASYTASFSGDCNASGSVTLSAGDDKTCTLTNTFIPPSTTASSVGGGYYNAPRPLIAILKTPNPQALPFGPGSVTYTYTVTNVGKVAMGGVWVKDDKCPLIAFISGDINKDLKLDTNEIWTYLCTKSVQATETNISTTHGSANGWDGYASAEATVVVALPLSMSTTVVDPVYTFNVTRQASATDPVVSMGFPDTGFPPGTGNLFLDMWENLCNRKYN